MPPSYRIHPGIGIARLGDSPTGFCISPEAPAVLPTACDENGNPMLSADGLTETTVASFKDAEGRIKRQAARFQIYVYDESAPEGRPLRLGDPVEGGGNDGVLIDIQWRVHLANKKAVWYRFSQLEGEHGYAPGHPRRNAAVAGTQARQQLIVDPGPQIVDRTTRRHASFGRDRNDGYAATFPPPDLKPHSVDTLGDLLTDDAGRLLVLGGHGRSGSFLTGFGQPRIDDYANNDGWFDDTSDGPVMARLVMYSKEVGAIRFVDVEYPAWVLVGYPRYVPEILDMITLDDVVLDMSIRNFAYRTDLYGTAGTFGDPQRIDPGDTGALLHWKAGRLVWNAAYKPWFWRDVWPILFRAEEMTYLTNVLEASNYPHNQSERGSFDPFRLCVPPHAVPTLEARLHEESAHGNETGELLLEAARSALELLDRTKTRGAADALDAIGPRLRDAAAAFAAAACPRRDGEAPSSWLRRWKEAHDAHRIHAPGTPDDDYDRAARAFEATVAALISEIERGPKIDLQPLAATFGRRRRSDDPRSGTRRDEPAVDALKRHLRDFRSGRLLQEAIEAATLRSTHDQYRDYRRYLYDLLRQSGEENVFQLGGKPDTRISNLPLMPLLAGDNPISNVVPSKFLRLTDHQLFVLRQWADGLFHDEVAEGWVPPSHIDPFDPTANWVNRTARDLDRGVLTNLLGGAFCPGGEVGWIIRNPAIWKEPYRLKADPAFYAFQQTAAQASATSAPGTVWAYSSYASEALSQDSDYAIGLQPGDLTKMSSLPWQSDFNECSTQNINVTYEYWNQLAPGSVNDTLLEQEDRVWETLWWPAHRPLQVLEVAGVTDGSPSYRFVNWTPGVPQTKAGDFKMTTEWSKLGFVVRNPYISRKDGETPSAVGPAPKYICIERGGSE